MSKARALGMALFALTLASAEENGFRAPLVGFVRNAATSAIHPINGVPGASYLGLPVLTGVQSASVSRDADAAIATTPDGVFAVTSLLSGSPQWQLLATGAGYLVSWGQNAGVAYAGGSFTLLSRSGEGSWITTPLAIGLPAGTVNAIDFEERNQRVLIAMVLDDGSGGVYDYSLRDSTVERVLPVENPGSITHAGDQVFVLADAKIWSLQQNGGNWKAVQLPIESAPNSHFVAIAASLDEQRLYAADAGLQQIGVYDFLGSAQMQLPVSAQVSKLERLGAGASLLLNNDAGQPVYLLNDTANPQIYFVPAWVQ